MLGALPSLPRPTTNRTASYLPKVRTKTKKSSRPGTAESSKQLIPKDGDGEKEKEARSPPAMDPRHSFVYTHYQHSLNSLGDILDRVRRVLFYFNFRFL